MKIEKIIELLKQYNYDIPIDMLQTIIKTKNSPDGIILYEKSYYLYLNSNKTIHLFVHRELLDIDITEKDQYFNYSLQYNLPEYEKVLELMSIILDNDVEYFIALD